MKEAWPPLKQEKKAIYNVITVTQHIAEFAGNNIVSPVLYIYPENGSGWVNTACVHDGKRKH